MELSLLQRIIELSELIDPFSGLRQGQAYMIALYYIDPKLYNNIYGTESDCFYQDSQIKKFLQVVESKTKELKS